jgi:hypothetical protein
VFVKLQPNDDGERAYLCLLLRTDVFVVRVLTCRAAVSSQNTQIGDMERLQECACGLDWIPG